MFVLTVVVSLVIVLMLFSFLRMLAMPLNQQLQIHLIKMIPENAFIKLLGMPFVPCFVVPISLPSFGRMPFITLFGSTVSLSMGITLHLMNSALGGNQTFVHYVYLAVTFKLSQRVLIVPIGSSWTHVVASYLVSQRP
jgi:hypothetical protein